MNTHVLTGLVAGTLGCLAGGTLLAPAGAAVERPSAPRQVDLAELRDELRTIRGLLRVRAAAAESPPCPDTPPERPAAPSGANDNSNAGVPRAEQAADESREEGWPGDARPVSWSRLEELRGWEDDPALRRRWLLQPPRAVQEWLGMPDRIAADGTGGESWTYEDAGGGGGRRVSIVFFRRRLVEVRE